ncbi:predicted protein [Histoplasma capsulatum G186AR]|uniref:Uncharacterized protein n=1 Tax=Ajellomyces capsulatus (strain G186AR / H82 / ATCC MYA-2454 / RMSCC 2432) TaxID=447093 RepID=C0NV17_AJECG|nr:uncharacterized protein HCBG_06781 [Histoplasma capsulatum G186AR]EEH04830.1 predicted protein [Histoplasma capsulatum G186AR]
MAERSGNEVGKTTGLAGAFDAQTFGGCTTDSQQVQQHQCGHARRGLGEGPPAALIGRHQQPQGATGLASAGHFPRDPAGAPNQSSPSPSPVTVTFAASVASSPSDLWPFASPSKFPPTRLPTLTSSGLTRSSRPAAAAIDLPPQASLFNSYGRAPTPLYLVRICSHLGTYYYYY